MENTMEDTTPKSTIEMQAVRQHVRAPYASVRDRDAARALQPEVLRVLEIGDMARISEIVTEAQKRAASQPTSGTAPIATEGTARKSFPDYVAGVKAEDRAQRPESDEQVLRRLLDESELRHGKGVEQRALIGALRNIAITPVLQERNRELIGFASDLDVLLGDPAKSPTTPDGKHITVPVADLLAILRPLRQALAD